mmetsp:Transcript_158872/g.280677  ORF Transcript_158872/g.280677 Transcript_158872/m.280677 type:complete len:214 (+) Transcript_158872:22-663(+)
MFSDGSKMFAHSLLLCLASPVFDAMWNSGMSESREKFVKIEVATKDEFANFYEMLKPISGRKVSITSLNVSSLLTLSEYYQIENMKEECVEFLNQSPITVCLLVQAKLHKLDELYAKCLNGVVETFDCQNFDSLLGHEDVAIDVMQKAQSRWKAMRSKIDRMEAKKKRALECIAETEKEATFEAFGQRKMARSNTLCNDWVTGKLEVIKSKLA